MRSLGRIVAAVLLVSVAVFCSFGFMATFEPLDPETRRNGRILYGLALAICVVALVRLALPRRSGS